MRILPSSPHNAVSRVPPVHWYLLLLFVPDERTFDEKFVSYRVGELIFQYKPLDNVFNEGTCFFSPTEINPMSITEEWHL